MSMDDPRATKLQNFNMAAGTGGAGTGTGGAGTSSGTGGILWQIIWLILLILIVIWVSGFTAWLYIIILPFTVCIPHLAWITDVLLKVTQLPYFCTKNMMERNTINEALAHYADYVPPTAATITT